MISKFQKLWTAAPYGGEDHSQCCNLHDASSIVEIKRAAGYRQSMYAIEEFVLQIAISLWVHSSVMFFFPSSVGKSRCFVLCDCHYTIFLYAPDEAAVFLSVIVCLLSSNADGNLCCSVTLQQHETKHYWWNMYRQCLYFSSLIGCRGIYCFQASLGAAFIEDSIHSFQPSSGYVWLLSESIYSRVGFARGQSLIKELWCMGVWIWQYYTITMCMFH